MEEIIYVTLIDACEIKEMAVGAIPADNPGGLFYCLMIESSVFCCIFL